MNEHPNAALARALYAAFSRGDIPAVLETFTDDIGWHVPGNSPISGDRKGKGEVAAFFQQLAQIASSLALEVHDVVANDDHVVVLVRPKHARGAKRLEMNVVHVWHVREGKLAEFWEFPADTGAWDEFWS